MAKHPHDKDDEMMSIKESIGRIADLLGKTPTQREYRVHSREYDLTAEQLAALKTIDTQSIAEALDERLVKKTGPGVL